MGIGAILQLLNVAAPTVANLIVAIKSNTGGVSAIVYLDQADKDFAANQQQVTDWLSSKGLNTMTVPVTPSAPSV